MKGTIIQHWGLRKLSVGVASMLLGTTAYLGLSNGTVVHADTITSNNNAGNDVATNSKGAMSQNLYQRDDIQTTKEQASTNGTGTTQATSQGVTNSKNSNNVVNVDGSNNQDVPRNYQVPK